MPDAKRARGFLQVPHVLLRSGMDPIVLRVYLVTASHADGRSGVCTASRDTIAAESGCSPAAVKRALSRLQALDLATVEVRAGRPNVVRVRKPRDLQTEDLSAQSDTSPDGVGSHRPGVGSHRPGGRVTQTPEEDIEKKTEEKKTNPKTDTSVRRHRYPSDRQLQMLRDLILLLDLDDDPDAYLASECLESYEEADALIKEYWQHVEHTGRLTVAYDADNLTVYNQLSAEGQAFVRRTQGAA